MLNIEAWISDNQQQPYKIGTAIFLFVFETVSQAGYELMGILLPPEGRCEPHLSYSLILNLRMEKLGGIRNLEIKWHIPEV